MQKLLQAIQTVFPGTDVSSLQPDTKMSQIPGWDSMNAINLVLEIENTFGCSNLSIEFGAEKTFGQLCDELRAHKLAV